MASNSGCTHDKLQFESAQALVTDNLEVNDPEINETASTIFKSDGEVDWWVLGNLLLSLLPSVSPLTINNIEY